MSQERPEIAETIERWAQSRLEDLAAEAGEVASRFYLRAARERASRPRSEWGQLGVRVRALRTARAAPGSFAIEWFTRRWVNKTGAKAQTFTTYLRRGTGDRYPRSAFAAAAQPWESELAETLEERFAEIRRVARSVSRVRMAFRLHAKLERMVAEAHGQSNHATGEQRDAASPHQ